MMVMASPLHRAPGWPQRLAELICARLARPFEWGPNDCAAFGADAAAALTCADPLAELRGHRLNARQAVRRARAIGGVPAAIERAGFKPIAPALAQRGDLVQICQGAQGRHPVLAVCNGDHALAPGPRGLENAPMARAVAAWRV